jgi:DNA-binding PadR family transcriptional regulator
MTDASILILASLAEGDNHGYGIMLDVQQFAGVELGPGTLYTAITRLVDSGWIRPLPSADKRRRPYRITAQGRTHLQEEAEQLAHVASTALRRLKPA